MNITRIKDSVTGKLINIQLNNNESITPAMAINIKQANHKTVDLLPSLDSPLISIHKCYRKYHLFWHPGYP